MNRERPATHDVPVIAVSGRNRATRDDVVAVEEPLELRVGFGAIGARRRKSLSITMRTPGADGELAIGFLLAEQIIASRDDVLDIVGADRGESNVVLVELHPRVVFDEKRLQRQFVANSSCGICGKAFLESLSEACIPVLPPASPTVPPALVSSLPGRLRDAQSVFESTGGVHAAGLYSSTGDPLFVREDIGRHNAVDKVVGARLMSGSGFGDTILVVSGRVGYEVVQKALVAGVPILVAVGAPSSLAVSLADEFGMTLVGFARGERFNIYTGSNRIALPEPAPVGAR